tara:strand:- start:29865 stop:30701 length:837 start_codon:yes stop_codon:yes gene_type:complete
MNSLGTGESNGAISILHALGTGRGCSIGVELCTKVEIMDEKITNIEDKHGLLESVISCWKDAGLPVPDKFGWKISTDIPIGQGLKSSSALACAALKALNSIFMTNLDDCQIIDLAVEAQIRSNCTISGSIDDTWASISTGWKLIDSSKKASNSIFLQGDIEDGFSIIICTRGARNVTIKSILFQDYQSLFKKSSLMIERGEIFEAMTTNGVAVAGVTNDHDAIRICNLAIINGAISAGISGSGPAIAIICYNEDIDKIGKILMSEKREIIKTKFLTKL